MVTDPADYLHKVSSSLTLHPNVYVVPITLSHHVSFASPHHQEKGEYSTVRHCERETTCTNLLLQYIGIIIIFYYIISCCC